MVVGGREAASCISCAADCPKTMWRMVKEIVKDARFVLQNRTSHGDLELARAKRIHAEKILVHAKELAATEEQQLLQARDLALKQLQGMERFSKALDEHNERILEQVRSGRVKPLEEKDTRPSRKAKDPGAR